MINLEEVTYRYPGGNGSLVDGLSLTMPPATITALVGRSGSGKSTFLYLVGLLLRPTRGDIVINSVPTYEMSDGPRSQLRNRSIGFVFQDAVLDSGRSLLDNVAEPAIYAGSTRSNAHQRAAELLTNLGVDLPPNRRPGQISGGQAQRVGICRALMNDPPIILADEPTGNLDGENRDHVLRVFASERDRGKTLVIATHDEAVAAIADQVVRL